MNIRQPFGEKSSEGCFAPEQRWFCKMYFCVGEKSICEADAILKDLIYSCHDIGYSRQETTDETGENMIKMLWMILGGYLGIVNLAAFIAYGLDKYYAIKGKWRIPERTLLLMAGFGGAIGAGLGMLVFHHKVRKPKFTIGVSLILTTQILIVLFLLMSIGADAAV